jgi:hypothetical protein
MSDNPSTEKPATGTMKKPYEKPSFRYEKVFVTSALSCGKTAQQSDCFSALKVS